MLSVKISVNTTGLVEGLNKDVDELERELAFRIVDEARTLIDSSTPSGRLYRRGSFRRGMSRGLGQRASGPGRRFHRASAPGQPPAEDTGKTYREIRVVRLKQGQYRIRFGGMAGYLEFGTRNMRPRPYIMPAIEAAVKKTFG